MRYLQLFFSIIVTLALAGCEAYLAEQDQDYAGRCDEELLQGLEDIPRLYLGAPPNDPQPWETNASVLRDSIAFDDGQAIIELKDSESKRFRESHGYREALTAGQFETAMHMLYSRGVEIIDVHNTFGAVEVLMNRDKVFELYDHPMVDYIDFPLEFGLGWNLPKE